MLSAKPGAGVAGRGLVYSQRLACRKAEGADVGRGQESEALREKVKRFLRLGPLPIFRYSPISLAWGLHVIQQTFLHLSQECLFFTTRRSYLEQSVDKSS